jgi:Tol biopolymer transport system component
LCIACLIAAATSGAAQEIVFSRRVFAAQGPSFQQLWTWSASDGSLTQLTSSARHHGNPVCSADGAAIFFDGRVGTFETSRRWRFDRKTGAEEPAAREAAAPTPMAGSASDLPGDLSRLLYPKPLEVSIWSPDRRQLLVGVNGARSNSSEPELDFFLVDASSKRWTKAMSGNNPMWLPRGDAIVYETARRLVPLPPNGRHSEWSAHLARFDAATRTETVLTSGLTNNVTPVLCRPNP